MAKLHGTPGGFPVFPLEGEGGFGMVMHEVKKMKKECFTSILLPGEVLAGWTYNGQKANFDEDRLGTLEKGKLADIAVLNRNIFKEHGDRLKETKVCMTICDGKIVYQE